LPLSGRGVAMVLVWEMKSKLEVRMAAKILDC